MNRPVLRVFSAAVVLALCLTGVGLAQNPNCGVQQGSADTILPAFSGTLPGSGDVLSLGGGSTYLYVLTQWGFARSSLANPADPGPYQLGNIGKYHGNGGVVPITCDCHQGSNTMDVAQAPDGSARMISDWQPFVQGDGDSGLAAQLGDTVGSGSPGFGQQIDLPDQVKQGGRIAAIYAAPHYYGYFPVAGSGVYMANLDSPSGALSPPIGTTQVIGWASAAGSTPPVRVKAGRVSVPGYDEYLLAGVTYGDLKLHVAEINTSTGSVTEVASGSLQGDFPDFLDIAVVNNEIFIFAAGAGGLRVYAFNPPAGNLPEVGSISGNMLQMKVRGPQPFPAIFVHRGTGPSFIDIYDSKWLTQGGSPLLAKSLPHAGAPDGFLGNGFEALVQQNGAIVTAYLYREIGSTPEKSIRTTTVDISCIAADPTAPPVPLASMTNLSAAARTAPENAKNYYGDRWRLTDSSVSFLPLTELDWDFRYTAPFAPEAIDTAPLETADINPAYWPCDELSGGDIQSGTGCYQSLGTPTSTYQLAMTSKNGNTPNPGPYVSPAITVASPQVSVVGFDGTLLSLLSGGNADARPSQGNTGDATFAWTFTPGGAASGINPPIPSGAGASGTFSVTANYKGGYSNTKAGAYQLVDLVPNFSVSPNPVLINSPLTLRNLMQIGGTTTLISVDYALTSSASPPGSYTGALGAPFLAVNGTTTVPAPATQGSFWAHLRYNFSGPGPVDQLTASQPFSTTTFVFNPVLGVYKNSNHTSYVGPAPGNPPTWNLTLNTTYYLFDDENTQGLPHPGVAFYKSTNSNPTVSGDTQIGTANDDGPVTFQASPACTSDCYIKVQVSGVVTVWAYRISSGNPNPCPPDCGPNPTPTLALSGPTTGVAGTAVSFTATATDYTPTTYSWSWGDGAAPPPPPPPPPPGGEECIPGQPCPTLTATTKAVANGSQTQTHTYAAAGAYTVSVTASAGSTSRTSTRTISIGTGGPPLPSTQYTLAGAEFEPLTGGWRGNAGSVIAFAATEPDPLATFAWNFGDGSTGTGRAVSHVWTSDGVKTVTLTVTGGGTQTAGTNIGTIRLSLAEPDFRALMIPGAGSILSAAGDWATDLSITNPGTQSMVITLYFASFSDQIPADLSTLPFDTLDSFPLGGGESWSGVDVVGSPEILNRRGAGKGILFARFEGGNELPIATTRVYFTSQGSSFGTALPSVLTGPFGQTTAQQIEATTAQTLVGLRNDPLYRFNVSLFNASSQGGLFHVDIFSEDGAQVASEDFAVPPYSQAGVNDTDLFTPDPSKRYVLKATGTSGKLQAYASVLDRRNNDLVQVADETPRVAAAAGAPVSYYISGVGRIEIPETNTHWRTDLSFYNPSESARPVILEYHYTPTGSTTEKVVLTRITIETGQLVTADDIVGNDAFLDGATEEDLKTGSILGLLKVSYNVPLDGAPLIIGGRIYADLSTGTAGMQLSTYTADASVAPGSSSTLVMPGAQTNLRFRTNIGIFTQGDEPTPVQIKAIKQDGTEAATFNYTLNDLGHTGAFAQIPITPDTFPGIDGNAMTIKVKALSGSPVGAYIVTVDQISTDTVFIQGKRVN